MRSFVGFMSLLITVQLFHSEPKLVIRRFLASADVEGMATFDRFARHSLQRQPGSSCKFCISPSSHALDSAVPWLESLGNSVLHCLHPFNLELWKTIQLSQNISPFYTGSIMIIFQFYGNSHWSCQHQHRNSCAAMHECVLITLWSGKTITLQMVSLEDVALIRCTVLKLAGVPRARLFYTKPPLAEPPSLLGWECPDGIFRSLLILHFCCLTLHPL